MTGQFPRGKLGRVAAAAILVTLAVVLWRAGGWLARTGDSDDALAGPPPMEPLGLADGVLFRSGDHPDPAVSEIGMLGQALFVGAVGTDRVVLVDRTSMLLLFVDLQTNEVSIQGGNGAGPGEFRGIAPQLGRGPNGLVAWDVNMRRASYWSSDGDLVATRSVRGLGTGIMRGFHTFLGELESGGGLAFEELGELSDAPSGSVDRPAAYISIARPDDDMAHRVREFPTYEVLILRDPPRNPLTAKPVLFGDLTLVAVAGDHVVVADTETDSIVSYDSAGAPAASMPFPGDGIQVSESQVETVIDSLRELDQERAALGRPAGFGIRLAPDDYVVRREAPAIDKMQVDWNGRLWIRRFRMPDDAIQHWTVWDGNRQELSVELPVDAHFMDARDRRVLLMLEDELGVRQAVVREISPGAGGGRL